MKDSSPSTTPAPDPSPGAAAAPRRPSSLRRVARRTRALSQHLMARRRSVDGVVVGVLLTLLVISVDSAGALTQVEFVLYDLRATVFQFFLPKPSDKLVHLDVDEGVLRAVDASEHVSWPWPRSLLAE